MWFKNLYLYRFLQPLTYTAEELHEKLSEKPFQPCGRLDIFTQGWISPVMDEGEYLVHAANNCMMLTLQREEKILPSSVIRDHLKKKVKDIEERESRKVKKHEKDTMKDEILQELLPRAFTRFSKQYAYIDLHHGWLILDTASPKKAEEFASFLRQTLGSLPIVPPRVQENPARAMTQWLVDPEQRPPDFILAESCELSDSAYEGSIIYCKRQDLASEEVKGHVEAGKLVTRLALYWNDRLGMVLDEDLGVRKLLFLDVVQEQREAVDAETYIQQFDADFAIMVLELGDFIPRLLEVFGGEDEAAYEQLR